MPGAKPGPNFRAGISNGRPGRRYPCTRLVSARFAALGLPLVTRDRKIRAADIETIW
jgi:PIN domain nuclease of toxin-antitoxin system